MVSARTVDDGRIVVVDPADATGPVDEWNGIPDDVSAVSVPTAADALAELADRTADCLLAPQRLPDGTGLELLERVRERDPTLPVVLAPRDGDEALASEAVAAGVTEYVPRGDGDDDSGEALAAALERAIESGRKRRDRRERARQFDAVFEDPETAAWVLAPDGRVRRANEAALEVSGAADRDVRGRSFSGLSWCRALEGGSDAIADALERAATGEVVRRELTRTESADAATADGGAADDRPRTVELTVRPVRNGGEDGNEEDDVTALLARATDVTERARLEAELRESEELHRVTLNNMTDTVLITDDDGEFTYVCPNVHFIFGYSDDEIREMGTIDELLGPDLFDREELAAEGVLTNVECAATDKAGREHTLLINVREVSIQGGTLLYSCRDITKRKRREEALTALHQTSRELLYAETDREIATAVVEDATDVLDLEASAAYLFDTDENVLRPVARSEGMSTLHGPLSTRPATRDSITGSVFVEGENRFFQDVRDSPALSSPTTEIRSAGFVPLGDHGVFLAGTDAADAFDDVSRELTDLLATTAEAALDRVERERRLRERDRELKQRNRELARLNRINEIIREIDAALVRAETRAEIERAVCDRLTTADRFSFAWIGSIDAGGDELAPQARAATDRGGDYLDAVSLSLEEAANDRDGPGDPADEPSVETAREREVTVVSNVADDLRADSWRSEALACEYHSIISVPIAYDEFTYGVLTVYADRPDAFDDVTRAVLAELGETVASAIAGVERKSALLSDASTRLEFDVRDESFVLSRLARRADCTLSFDGGVRQREDGVTVFATVDGASATAVARSAEDLVAVERAQVLGDELAANGAGDPAGPDADGGTILLTLDGPFLASRLADHGAVLRSVEATPERARLVVDVPSEVDERKSANVVSSALADVDLRSKRTVDRTTGRNLRSELLERLTDRQLEVVQLAYYAGYFESPRNRSGEEIADSLGISPAAFYRHNRTVQRKLFEILFDEFGIPATPAAGVE